MDLRATPNLVHLSESGQRSVQLEVARGFRIVAVSGEIWVTQTGFIDDYILRSGDELTLQSDGPAVVTSFGPADIEVVTPSKASASYSEPHISPDLIERLQRDAHRLRAEAVKDMFDSAAAWLRTLAHRAVALITPADTARGRCQHC